MKKTSIYMAAPLFGAADRHHNLLLARELEKLGYLVVLPQKEALKFFNGEHFDLKGIREDCKKQAMKKKNRVTVANLDGTDADSGTSVEVGPSLAVAGKNKPKVIGVRTDFRTDLEKEIGINGMFGLADKIIYKPAYFTSLEEVAEFYKNLAKEIDNAIKELMAKS